MRNVIESPKGTYQEMCLQSVWWANPSLHSRFSVSLLGACLG